MNVRASRAKVDVLVRSAAFLSAVADLPVDEEVEVVMHSVCAWIVLHGSVLLLTGRFDTVFLAFKRYKKRSAYT